MVGTVLGHEDHPCPGLPCGLWGEGRCSPGEPFSMGKVAEQRSSPLPMGAEEGGCARQLKGPGDRGSRLGGLPEGLAEPSS